MSTGVLMFFPRKMYRNELRRLGFTSDGVKIENQSGKWSQKLAGIGV